MYVGNLSWNTAWQGLKDHMKQAGEGESRFLFPFPKVLCTYPQRRSFHIAAHVMWCSIPVAQLTGSCVPP